MTKLLRNLKVQFEQALQVRKDYPSDLMVKTTNFTVQATLDDIRKALTSRGLVYDRSLQSALYHVRYLPAEAKGKKGRDLNRFRSVWEISGWHGSGKGNRNYGDGLTVLDVFHGGKGVTILNSGDVDYIGNTSYFVSDAVKKSYLIELEKMRKAFLQGNEEKWFKS